MIISVFDLFSIGIGPSSSHTVGPMKAANLFVTRLHDDKKLNHVKRLSIELFGSLAFTGKGHGTDAAILLGLEHYAPDTIDPSIITPRSNAIVDQKKINLYQNHPIHFEYGSDFIYNMKDLLPLHTNGMRFSAFDDAGHVLLTACYYSIGGGFVIDESNTPAQTPINGNLPYPFSSAKTLLTQCTTHQLSISELMLRNEAALHGEEEVKQRLLHITNIMMDCIERGCHTPGILPGGLKVKRRAYDLHQKLMAKGKPTSYLHMDSMAWLNLYAIAVNEENAAGGRVVTAPTNGAAGIMPAVLAYYLHFFPNAQPAHAIDFLLTAGAFAILYKKGASISGAEVGCQGEVGVACSMAAGARRALLGGTLDQIENAAEIAMEHHLGLTCDPMMGLVQIPCIERNAMGAVKAFNAARLALLGDGQHHVTLDKVIATMMQTGKDMMSIYKETSLGGLAANLPEC